MLSTLYNTCNLINQTIPVCKNEASCYDCISGMFQQGVQDRYTCTKLVFEYTLNYMPAFVTEIYAFLQESQILELIGANTIRILSLGGGLGTDYLAITKYLSDKQIQKAIDYTLIDQTPQWQYVRDLYQHDNAVFIIESIFSCQLSPHNYDIIFMNKLYSTLHRNQQTTLFWEWFKQWWGCNQNNRTLFVFHDNNSFYTERDTFNNKAIKLFSKVAKYYTSGHCYPEYIMLPQLCITETTGITTTNCLSRMTESVFFVYI